MWILYAVGSAFFAGLTTILAKIGSEDTDSHLLTALRTFVVLIFAWIITVYTGTISTIVDLDRTSLIYLLLSGMATGLSWLCYFSALKLGDVNKVVPVDKASTVLTIILAILFLGDPFSLPVALAIISILTGTMLMIQKSKSDTDQQETKNSWFIYAVFSAIFASLTTLLAKLGLSNVDSHLATAIRTTVVLVFAWIIVFSTKKHSQVKLIHKKSWLSIALSGVCTGLSWLCYYKALKDGTTTVVVSIDKLSIAITILLSYLFLKEKISRRAFVGLLLLILGTFLLLVFQ